jgi:hypothetical protein
VEDERDAVAGVRLREQVVVRRPATVPRTRVQARHRYATVDTTQFVELAGYHAATDLSAFFTAWLHRPALPGTAVKRWE